MLSPIARGGYMIVLFKGIGEVFGRGVSQFFCDGSNAFFVVLK